MPVDELLNFLFEKGSNPLQQPVADWLASSRRFSAFVLAHQTKIRKKIRSTRDPETLRDLQLELETAWLLLRERSLDLAYEPVHPHEGRSPDFAVSFTTSLTFMLEVTRLRLGAQAFDHSTGDRFTDVLCGKLRQLLSHTGNVLLVGVEGAPPAGGQLHASMLRIQQRAERSDPSVVERQGFRGPPDFFRHYRRLSAVLVRGIPNEAGQPPLLWDNPQTAHPLPPRVRLALSRALSV